VNTGGFRLAMLLLAASPAAAQEPRPPGAASCTGCHVSAEAAPISIPPITGLPAEAITEAMLAYKAGERSPTVMGRIAKGFSDDEIRAIAAWFAAPHG
jgi:cytochrome subunit of sulfide dehydrogenase